MRSPSTATKSSHRSPQLEKAHAQQDPKQPEKKKIFSGFLWPTEWSLSSLAWHSKPWLIQPGTADLSALTSATSCLKHFILTPYAHHTVLWPVKLKLTPPSFSGVHSSPFTKLTSMNSFFFFFNIFIYLFIYLWLHWVFIAERRLSLVAASQGFLFVAVYGLSSCGSRVLEHRLSSCGTQA